MGPAPNAEKPRPRHSGDAPFQGSRPDSDAKKASNESPQAEYDEELSASFNRLLSVTGSQPAATRAQKVFLPDLHAAPKEAKDSQDQNAKEKAPEKVDAPDEEKNPSFLGKIMRKFFGK